MLLFPVFPDVRVWIVLQLVSGIMLGHFYIVTEAWLNHFADESLRARVTAIYGILPAVGYAIGAGIYTLVGFRGVAPFVAAAMAMTAGLVPLVLMPGARVTSLLVVRDACGRRRAWYLGYSESL